MEPENEPLEEEIPIKNHHFSGSMLVFDGVFLENTSATKPPGPIEMKAA